MNRVLSAARTAVAAAVSLVFLVSVAPAAVIRIPSDQPTIAAGIAAASAGDTLLLADGQYLEHGLVITRPVTIASEHGAGYSSIEGQGGGRILWIEGVDGVVIRNLTLAGGQADEGAAVFADTASATFVQCVFVSNVATSHGGGVYCNRAASEFTGCNFVENDAALSGGGVVVNGAACGFEDCCFVGNEAWWGGGVAIYNPGAAPVFEWCDFRANRAVSPPGNEPYGGGAYCWNYAAPTFSHCDFTDNTSQHGGAGLMSDQECQITLSECTFQGNTAVVGGGGIETWWTRGGSVTGCSFTDNTAQYGAGVLYEQSQNVAFTGCAFTGNQASGSGGGFDLDNATPGPVNCTFTGNSAVHGGAVAVEYCVGPVIAGCSLIGNSAQFGGGVAIDTCDSPVVSGCTIAENVASVGGGIAISHCSTPSVVGSTLVLNRADTYGGGIAVAVGTALSIERTIIGFGTAGGAVASDGCPVNCSVTSVFGNAGGDWTGIIAGQDAGNHNVATDPLFCGVLAGDYTLCADSPCLPANNGAGVLMGAHGQGCDGPCGAPVEPRSWGSIKAMYRSAGERRAR